MDHEIITLFSVEEFTDLAHGMTARSTRSKTPIQRRKGTATMEKRIPIPCSITMIKGSKGFETVRYRINPETSIETSTSFIKVLKAHPFNAEK